MDIKAYHGDSLIGVLFENSEKEYAFEYSDKADTHLCLSMPNTQRIYLSRFHLHPFFDTFLPEGYLFELLRGLINKREGRADDFTMLYYLAGGVEGRIRLEGEERPKEDTALFLEEILENDTWDAFRTLLNTFLYRNAIGGVQPKTLAVLEDKVTLEVKEYIVKTFREEHPELARNEYLCMKAVERAGVKIPKVYLSRGGRFLVVEKFTYDREKGEYLGFEEIGSLLGRRRDTKYEGSYEQIAKVIRRFSTCLEEDLKTYYRLIVMNFLLRNGDAHVKNFGLIYTDDFSEIRLAPAYDVVCTTVYIPDDKPALFMHGTKRWHGKDKLMEFGMRYCGLSREEAKELYDICENAVEEEMEEVKDLIREEPGFREVGERMVKEWEKSIVGSTPLSLPLREEEGTEIDYGP